MNRWALSAVIAVFGVALASPPAIAAPYQPVAHVLAQAGELPVTSEYDGRRISYFTYVANVGDQQTINECTGGLTFYTEISDFVGKPYYPIHNECGGKPILQLKLGDLVSIHQVGVFEVISLDDVVRGDTAIELLTMKGDAYLQTCFDTGDGMRVVGLGKLNGELNS
jgi:hypothetical protein